ncbi:MAG: hypothetical protein AAF998_14125 [Bacteroidota bacterium]
MAEAVKKLTYQAIGLYAYFPDIDISSFNLTTDDKIETFLDAVKMSPLPRQGQFRYSAEKVEPNDNTDPFFIVGHIEYNFNSGSTTPPNADSANSIRGRRKLNLKQISVPSGGTEPENKYFMAWQYYREVVAINRSSQNEAPVTIRLRSKGQPKFRDTALGGEIEWGNLHDLKTFLENYEVLTWRLIHRQVTVPVRKNLLEEYQRVDRKLQIADLYLAEDLYQAKLGNGKKNVMETFDEYVKQVF